MFFPLHFWGVNNMYWESERGEFLHPWRKGDIAGKPHYISPSLSYPYHNFNFLVFVLINPILPYWIGSLSARTNTTQTFFFTYLLSSRLAGSRLTIIIDIHPNIPFLPVSHRPD